ncbi:MAG: sugar phosphate isomerase/epimerase family protein [Candidatus Sumerlaeia bacterium]
MSYKVGIIGMVGEELKKDRWGTLEKLAGFGYQGLEGAVMVSDDKNEMKENRKRLADLGMETVALSCNHHHPEKLEETIENAKILGAEYIVTYWGPAESTDQVMKMAEVLEDLAVKCEKEGLTFLYHNHEHEFEAKLGEKGRDCAFDLIYNNTEKLRFELDVAWCHFGKSDPIRLIRRCGHRIPVLHIKDLADDNIRGYFSAIGMGVVDCFGAMEAGAAKGAKWMVVEEDRPYNLTHWESAVASILNIREAGLLIK